MNLIRSVGFGIVILAGTLHLSAQQRPATGVTSVLTDVVTARTPAVPSLSSVTPDALGMIQGNALDSTNRQLANVMVRLRDVRNGRIIGSQVTDHVGLFTFKDLDRGSYVVELMGEDETILATSEVIDIDAGGAAAAIVKLPFRLPPYAHVLGATAPNTASAIVMQAAATDLLAVSIVGEPTCSQ